MIAGCYSEGTRYSRMTSGGKRFDGKQIEIAMEGWSCPELKVSMGYTYNDPRLENRTTEVTELRREEPDAALFRVPEGYEVMETTEGEGKAVAGLGASLQ